MTLEDYKIESLKHVPRYRLVGRIGKDTGIEKKTIETVIKSLIRTVRLAVKAKEKVLLRGLATFDSREREAFKCFNPHSSKFEQREARRIARIIPSPEFNNSLN